MTRNTLRDQAMLGARNPEDVLAPDQAGCSSRAILVLALLVVAIFVLLQLTGGGGASPSPTPTPSPSIVALTLL